VACTRARPHASRSPHRLTRQRPSCDHGGRSRSRSRRRSLAERLGLGRCGDRRRRLRPIGRPIGRRARRRGRGWEELQRIQVALRVARAAQAEVHIWNVELRVATWPDRTDTRSFDKRLAPPDRDRAQMREGDRKPVLGLDCHALAADRDGPGEGDRSGGWSRNRRARGSADVDAPVLPARIRIFPESERSQHRALNGPGPGSRFRNREHAGTGNHRQHEEPHLLPLVVEIDNGNESTSGTLLLSIWTTRTCRRGASWAGRSIELPGPQPAAAGALRPRARPLPERLPSRHPTESRRGRSRA
jgi:hypothetical protein